MTAAVTEYRDREQLIDVREERDYWLPVEFREDKKSGEIVVEGYAATYDPYDVQGGPASGGWVEQLRSTAFDKTLADMPDVQLLINHEGMPLARTTSGTLQLSRDSHGLKFSATLDGTDPDVQRLAPKMRRGDMNECSFAFRVKDQTWDTNYTHRTINDLTLEKGDVSVVNYGMNPGTRAVIGDAIGALAQLSSRDFAELRGALLDHLDQDQLRRAQATLTAMCPPVAARKDTPKESRVDDTFADPGYKADGKKRYPVDTKEHAKAAWSYINMPKNQRGYTAEQLSAIKGRIKRALKNKFGVTVSEGKAATKLSYIDESVRSDGNTTLVAVMTDGSRVPLPSQRALPAATGNGEGEWHPSDSPIDPHDDPYKEGDMGTVGAGPIPDNIEGSSGSFQPDHPAYHDPSPASDPHDQTLSPQMLSMDPHDDPYDLGAAIGTGSKLQPEHGFAGEGGGDPHDTSYDMGMATGSKITPQHGGYTGEGGGGDPHATPYSVGAFGDMPSGPVEPNIVMTGLGSASPPSSLTQPAGTGTQPVVGGSKDYDWTAGTISKPSEPAENLDAPAERGIGIEDPGTLGSDKGHAAATHGTTNVTNIAGLEIDLGMAQALDRTIVHCYQLSKGNEELRKGLAVAWKQLNTLRGVAPPKNTDVTRKLAELRKAVGAPDTGSVNEGLNYLRSMGSAPIGYRGLLDHDPDLHMVGAAERMARDKKELAIQTSMESTQAEARVKAARREAELNDVIRRRMRTS